MVQPQHASSPQGSQPPLLRAHPPRAPPPTSGRAQGRHQRCAAGAVEAGGQTPHLPELLRDVFHTLRRVESNAGLPGARIPRSTSDLHLSGLKYVKLEEPDGWEPRRTLLLVEDLFASFKQTDVGLSRSFWPCCLPRRLTKGPSQRICLGCMWSSKKPHSSQERNENVHFQMSHQSYLYERSVAKPHTAKFKSCTTAVTLYH